MGLLSTIFMECVTNWVHPMSNSDFEKTPAFWKINWIACSRCCVVNSVGSPPIKHCTCPTSVSVTHQAAIFELGPSSPPKGGSKLKTSAREAVLRNWSGFNLYGLSVKWSILTIVQKSSAPKSVCATTTPSAILRNRSPTNHI